MGSNLFGEEGIDRRRFPRVKAPVLYRAPRLINLERKVRDISIGGVRIYSDNRLDVGKKIEIEFILPGGHCIVAEVRVVWTSVVDIEGEKLHEIGLEFIRLSPADFHELKKVLDTAEPA
jgi:hypothetical protein